MLGLIQRVKAGFPLHFNEEDCRVREFTLNRSVCITVIKQARQMEPIYRHGERIRQNKGAVKVELKLFRGLNFRAISFILWS